MQGPFLKHRKPTFSKRQLASIAGILVIIGTISAYILIPPRPTLVQSQLQLQFSQFRAFLTRYQKTYQDQHEFNKRFQIFRDNLSLIRAQNSLGHNWSLAPNQFSDLTFDEFGALYKHPYNNPQLQYTTLPYTPIPGLVNWVSSGAVTPVKDQGPCSSSWAFSATGSIQGAWKIAGHDLLPLSEQQLIDCSRTSGNQDFKNGSTTQAFNYISQHGITQQAIYPYTGKDQTCQTNLKDKIKIQSFANLQPQNKDQLLQAVSKQPISVTVQANHYIWQFFSEGIVDKNCGDQLDHQVLIVGYDLTNINPYWLVKNSWGTSWGQKGYIKIGISTGKGICGINLHPSYPII